MPGKEQSGSIDDSTTSEVTVALEIQSDWQKTQPLGNDGNDRTTTHDGGEATRRRRASPMDDGSMDERTNGHLIDPISYLLSLPSTSPVSSVSWSSGRHRRPPCPPSRLVAAVSSRRRRVVAGSGER
eukprot:9336749-Pyramimonas_sp.AAC.1